MKLLKIISVTALCCAGLPTHCAQKKTNPFLQQRLIPNSRKRKIIALPCERPEIDRIKPELSGGTALTLAVESHIMDSVANLLEKGADVNATNAHGQTPLHRAVYEGQFVMVKKLLESGAATSITDKQGYTPLATALAWNRFSDPTSTETTHGEIIELLFQHGADRTAHISSKTVFYATMKHNKEFLNRILICPGIESTINIKQQGWKNTPLESAVCRRNTEAVSLLLQVGADPNNTDLTQRTPLHFALNRCLDDRQTIKPKAAVQDELHIIELLLIHGAQIDEKTAPLAFKVGKAYNHPLWTAALVFDPKVGLPAQQ